MATRLDKPVIRETDLIYKMRTVIIELHQDRIEFRLKGTQQKVSVSLERIFRLARTP